MEMLVNDMVYFWILEGGWCGFFWRGLTEGGRIANPDYLGSGLQIPNSGKIDG
jgi:hypothetical protein